MKAHVTPSGSVALWDGALPLSYDGWFVDVEDEPLPTPTESQVVETGPLAIDYANGVPVRVRRTWVVRDKTDAEAQKVASQLTLWLLLSAAERRSLRAMANTEGPAGDAALQLEGALFSAVETESRNPQTKALLGAAIQLGIVSDVARAREILGDPGFSLT